MERVGVREPREGEQSYTTSVIGYPEDPYLAESDESNDMWSMITEGNIMRNKQPLLAITYFQQR